MPATPEKIVLDMNKILSGSASQEQINLFNAFLHANEAKTPPTALFTGVTPVYFVDKLPNPKAAEYEHYKNAYVFSKESGLSLSFINEKGEVKKIEMENLVKESILSKLKDVTLDATQPIIDQLKTLGNRRAIDAISAIIPSSIQAMPFPFTFQKKEYAIEFNQGLVRRQSKTLNPKGKPKYYYELFNATPFYPTNIRNLHHSLGTVKLTREGFIFTNPTFALSTKHKRVIKIESVENIDPQIVLQERIKQFEFLSTTRAGKGLKKPELVSTPAGHFIVNTMACIEGSSLDKMMEDSPQAFKANRFDIMEQVLENITSNFHSLEWLHRDIKPSNFMVQTAEDTVVQVIDLDDAIHEAEVKMGEIQGTQAFHAPELKHPDAIETMATDVFAMGITLLWIYKGHEVDINNLETEIATIPNQNLRELISQMTNEDPALRPSMMDATVTMTLLKPELEQENAMELQKIPQQDGSMRNIMTRLAVPEEKVRTHEKPIETTPTSPSVDQVEDQKKEFISESTPSQVEPIKSPTPSIKR